jgi:dienelactone hydrolase
MNKQFDHSALVGFFRDSFRASSGKDPRPVPIGSGPAVIVIHEVPGITPLVAAFGRKVAERGMTAVLPSLFGTPERLRRRATRSPKRSRSA